MKIILYIIILFSPATFANTSLSSFTLTGVVKTILLLKVSQINPNHYVAEVTSNNPAGFKLNLDHDGTLSPQNPSLEVSSQTEGAVYSFPIKFLSPPTFLSVSIVAD